MKPAVPPTAITIPYNYNPRGYQLNFWRAMQGGKKRAVLVWHRRAGKDKSALNFTISKMFPENGGRIGTFYHFLPTFAQGKKILWDGMDYQGYKFMDHFPPSLVAHKSETEMQVTLTNGSIYQIIGTDKLDNIIGTNPVGCIFSEYALQNPQAWELFRPILTENHGWAVFIYTPRGRNHGKVLYDMAKDNPDWFCERLTVDDTHRENGELVISPEDIGRERREGMSEELIQQEYYCSFEGYQEGSYYTKQLREAANRITSVPFNPKLPVATFWDLGIGDSTAIWFAQRVGQELHLIDYYETSGEGMNYYAKYLKDKPYNYCEHYFPHDADARELGTGTTRREVAENLGIAPIEIVPRLSVDDGINAVRMIFPRCWFDKEKCSQGLAALANYHKVRDDVRQEFKSKPEHDWSSHGSDAFRYFAVVVDNASFEQYDYHPHWVGDEIKVLSNYNH